MRCPTCVSDNPPEATVCAHCGAQLDRALPMREERKVVSVLFADVVDSTRLTAEIGPEGLRAQMARFFAIARAEVERFGGTVEKFIGDAVMAVFGLPLVHEDDAERAVRAGLAIRARVAPLVHASTLPTVRIGIHTGEVIADPHAVEKGEFMVTGEAVNLAARLQQHSPPGEVVIGESTYIATRGSFDVVPLRPFEVRGRPGRISGYQVIGARPGATSVRVRLPDIESPLVGRAEELSVLMRAVQRLGGGEGGILSLIGEAGLGKTRLIAEARTHSEDHNLLWIEGRSLSFSQTITYWPFIDILKRAAGINEQDSEEASWAKLEARVLAVVPERTEEILPYLGTILGLRSTGERFEWIRHLEAEAMRRQVYRSVRVFFERLTHERPLVLVFEDLHWADDSSVGLLEHLFSLVREVPLLLIITARPEVRAPADHMRDLASRDYTERYLEVTLTPLSQVDTDRLVRNLLADDLASTFREAVLRKAEGNPFFVEEVVRALIDLGALRRDEGGRWRILHPVEQLRVPETLRGVILARLDRLDEGPKDLLKVAAVMGRSFFRRVLEAVVGEERDLDRALQELQALDLVREKRREPEFEYVFKHPLIQEATYESIPITVRRDLHRRAGEAMGVLYADRLEEFYGELAYHYARAEEWEKAQAYLFKAGDRAGMIAADAEALAHYRQAVAAYERAFGERWDPLARAILERKVGDALFRRGEFEDALASFQRALVYLRHPAPHGRRAVGRAILSQLLVQLGHLALPWLFLQRREPDAVARERARLYEGMGFIDFFVDRKRLLLDVLMLLNVSERAGYDLGIARGSGGLGAIYDVIPLWALARRYHARAIALAERTEHPSSIALAHIQASFHYLRAGVDRTQVLRHSERAAEVRQAGELLLWAAGKVRMAWERRLRGEIATALAYSREIVRAGQEAGDPQVKGWGLGELGASLLQIGDVAAAIVHLDQAMVIFRGLPDNLWIIVGSSTLSRCYLRQGRGQEAVALLESAATVRRNRGFRGWLGLNFFVPLVEAYLFMAEREVGEQERQSWLARARRTCREAMRFSRFDYELAPGSSRCRGTLEWLQGQPSAAIRWWRRSVEIAEHMEWPYDAALTWTEVGRRTGDRKALELAGRTLARIGARLDLAPLQEPPADPEGPRSSETAHR